MDRTVRAPSGAAGRIAALAGATGAVALADARGAQWTKLLFNASTNPIAALTGLTHGELCDTGAAEHVTALVDEGRTVAQALGITLDSDPDALISQAAIETTRTGRACSRTCWRAGEPRSTCSTAASCEGERAGVPTPLHETITALVTGLEAGWAQ